MVSVTSHEAFATATLSLDLCCMKVILFKLPQVLWMSSQHCGTLIQVESYSLHAMSEN